MKSYTLITGASSGIGRATAIRLAAEGRNLILVARRKEKLEALAKELTSASVEIMTKPLDLTDRNAVDALFASFENMQLEAVINNAGAAHGRDALDHVSDEDLQGMIDLNVSAFLRVVHLSIPLLKKTQGHLVNIGSVSGLEVYKNDATYGATKHFVHAISKGVNLDMLGSGIRITEIAPGSIDTDFTNVRFKGDAHKVVAKFQHFEPLHAEDIADTIWYALSRPKHVNIQHMLIMPTAQSVSGEVAKK